MNAPASFTSYSPDGKPHIVYHAEYDQGSQEWLQARCGLLTASEMRLIIGTSGGGTITHYRATGTRPEKLTARREQALDTIGQRVGSVSELCFLADVSDGVLRGLIKDGAIEKIVVEQPRRFFAPSDDKERAHLYELLAQRISGYVEPHYIGDDMLRGHEDEVRARLAYSERYAPITECGLVTNNRWGFTIGYSPDGLVDLTDGLVEFKSRRQKYQIQTLVECVEAQAVPADYLIQVQTGLLVAERSWLDFGSYSGGLHMPVIRAYPDPVVAEAIVNIAGEFEHRLAAKLATYHEIINSNARLIPTERVIEQEMYA